MNWFLLVFILKVLSLIHGAPIEVVVDYKDDLPVETVILENSLQHVTENANNLAKETVDLKEEAKIKNNSMTTPTIIESLNENIKENSQNLNVNETFTDPVMEEKKSAENLKLHTKLNQTLENLDSTFKLGLKSLKYLGSSKISEDSQNSDNIDSTTILVRVDETPQEFLEHKTKAVLNDFDVAVKPSVDTFATGLKSLKNFAFNKNSQDLENLTINENVETATKASVILDQTSGESVPSKPLETINSAVKHSADNFNKGVKFLEDFGLLKNSNTSENVEATTSVNFDQTAEESEQSKSLETVNSAAKLSLENLSFQQSLAEPQNLNINKNIETTTSVNLDKTFEEIRDSKTLETINSALDKSVDTLNKGLENFGLHQNSADSQNSNTNENVEATTLVNFDQIAEESTKSKTLDIINSAAKQSTDTSKEGFKTLQNLNFNKNSQDLESLNIKENVETTPNSLMNLDQLPEEILKSNQPLHSLNAAVKQSGNTFTDGLDNFSIPKNFQDSQNLNINENIKTTATNLGNLDQIAVDSPESKPPAEGSKAKQTLEAFNSTAQESVNSFKEGLKYLNDFSFHQDSADTHNSNINENIETATNIFENLDQTLEKISESKPILETTTSNSFSEAHNPLRNLNFNTNSAVSEDSSNTENVKTIANPNLQQKSLEGSESTTFATINAAVEKSVDSLNKGFNVLKALDVHKNFENSQNSDNKENIKTTTSDGILDSKSVEIINSLVKQSTDTISEGLNALKNFSFNKISDDSQNLNGNVEQTTRESLEMKPILNPILDTLNSSASESVERFNKGLKNFENLSLNKNSEESQNSQRNYQIIDESIMVDQTSKGTAQLKSDFKQTSDFLNSAMNHSAVIFNEGVKILENFTNLDNTTTGPKPSIEEVEVAKIEEIFITTKTPIVNLFDKVKQIPVNLNEYLRKESDKSQQHFEQNSENNSEVRQLLRTSSREEEAKIFENQQKTEEGVEYATAARTEANIANIFNTTKSTLVNLKGTTAQILQENLEQNSTSNSAVDLLNNGVILMNNSLDLENSTAKKTNSSPTEILTTTEAPILNLFESLCLVPKDIPLDNTNNNDNVTPAYEELKHNVEEILSRTKKDLTEVKKFLTTTETPVLNLFERLCLVPKDIPLANTNNNDNVTPAYEELKHNVEEILNRTIEETPSESGDYVEEIPADLPSNDQTSTERTKKVLTEMKKILTTTEAPVLNIFESLCLVPKDIPLDNTNNNNNVTPAYEELKHNVEEILNRTIEETFSKSGDYVEEIPADLSSNNQKSSERIKRVLTEMKKILTTTETPVLNLFESLCLVPKDIPQSNHNNNENVTPAYEELKHNVEDILNATIEETSSARGGYIERIPADKMETTLISNEPSEGNSAFKHSENSFLDLKHNNKSDTELGISASINFNETINKNFNDSLPSNNNERTDKLSEHFNQILKDSQQFKISKTNAEELSTVKTILITSQIPTEILNENFTEISKDFIAAANEKVIEPEVGQDILQIAAKLIEEEDKIIDLNEDTEKNNYVAPNIQVIMNISEIVQTNDGKLELSPESEKNTANNENVKQNDERIPIVKDLDYFQNGSSGDSEIMADNLEGKHFVITEMPTISLPQLPNYQETIKEVPEEFLTTTEKINLPTSQQFSKIYENFASHKESQDINIPTELSTTETKIEDFMTPGIVNKLKDTTALETNGKNQESEINSNLQQNNQKKFSTFAIAQPETTINYNQFTTSPSTNTEETTLNVPLKFEKEINMAVKTLEATTQHHFQQFHQNLQKAFKTFNEWEAEHMKQEETTTTTTTNDIKTTSSLQEDNYTTAETTLQPLTHMEIKEYTTESTTPMEETTFETINNGMEEIPNLGVINENFVDKYQENFQENLIKTEVITTVDSITNIEEESSTSSPLIISTDDNTPQTTMTTNVLTTMAALPIEEISNQEEYSQQGVLERVAATEKTISKNDVNEDHSTAVARDYHENTTTENDGETTIVPLFARIQLQKDINSVSLVKYDNDFIEKEIVGENFVNNNNAAAADNKTIQQHQNQSNGEEVNKMQNNDDKITTHNSSEETTQFSNQEEEKMTFSTPETHLENMVTFIQHEDTTTFEQDDSSQTQLPLTQAAFMEEQQQQIESTTENNVQTHTTVTGEHNYETEIVDEITSTTANVNETITATTEPDVYSTTIVEAEIDTATTTLAPIQIEPEVRSRALSPPKLEYLQNEDGVEVFYGYSIVKRN